MRLPFFCVLTLLLALACGDSEAASSEESSGGEGPLHTAKDNVDREHERFKEAVAPTAEKIDEKAEEAVGEGKKAFQKITGEPVPDGSDGGGGE